ncbi:esterase [bacterium]|nr:esterase [bacterium]
MKKLYYLLFLFLLMSACDSTPDISDDFLDGDVVFDASIAQPENYLQSYANPNPSAQDAAKPVFIAIHGYSASTFEWDEFKTFSSNRTDYFISQVLLGGHGMTYDDFKKATWKTWQESIKTEYERLTAAGYSNINFVGSSTGGALLIELLASGYFDGKIAPRHFFLVDPIVVPSSKLLSITPLIGPVLGFTEADNTTQEDRYWYHYRHQETLQELLDVIVRVRKQLEDGITLPTGTTMKVYKSIKDATADPVSAVLIYKGIETSSGGAIDVEMVESDLHVFTRLALRSGIDSKDAANQLRTFNDIVSRGLN